MCKTNKIFTSVYVQRYFGCSSKPYHFKLCTKLNFEQIENNAFIVIIFVFDIGGGLNHFHK